MIIHPLVLLSVVDHYSRVLNKSNSQRVIGVLLGERNSNGVVDILNSYAIPFEEDSKNNDVWFLDHLYHETMFSMFKKINIKEKVVGWYSTGNNIRHNDILINNLMKNYVSTPVFVLIDTQQSNKLSIPTEAYFSQEEVDANGTIRNVFINIKSKVQALEPEEIGVEQLLREIHEEKEGILTSLVNSKKSGLQGMA